MNLSISQNSFQISFVIPLESPGRLALLITLMLCLVNMMIYIVSNSPKTNSLNAITTWLIFCIIHVTVALNQYGLLMLYKYLTQATNESQKMLKKIDIICLILSLSAFFTFNVVYWNSYLNESY